MALMGLDNVEWAASILDENKENQIKSKKELKAELAELNYKI